MLFRCALEVPFSLILLHVLVFIDLSHPECKLLDFLMVQLTLVHVFHPLTCTVFIYSHALFLDLSIESALDSNGYIMFLQLNGREVRS